MITLRELCDLTSVTRRTIQCYEGKGLLKAVSKNKMGHLLYDDSAIEQVNLIRFYQSIGFTLKNIKGFEKMSREEFKNLMRDKIVTLEAEKVIVDDKIQRLISIIDDEDLS
ncbi:MAG: MerR family transcriptional regulator [Pseudobutyrivibrio sp.]|uniref:MerR family transcriptional regulator n=1 Tax=Pseudobutyrivibrio sp. TaxID=2014367 RepID=UPI0025D6F0ED|nr:MerR family transcriptional regulator [Pseudobutyrivibrio sp.]MBQ6462811.1 MerR family transcriptional regulator [Pseudobutyrivibrio sp.]